MRTAIPSEHTAVTRPSPSLGNTAVKKERKNLVKADQSSIYRQLELLHLWCLETFENAPNQPMVQADIRIIAENVVQAQSAVAMALNTADIKQRFDLLDVVVVSLTNIKSITKVLTEYAPSSVRKKKMLTENEPGSGRGSHVISKSARVRLLDIMSTVGNELGRWRNKTAAQIKGNAATLPD